MHALLARQLRKALPGGADPSLDALIAMVDAAYCASDKDRIRVERTMLIASEELYEKNLALERELRTRKQLEVELQQAEKLRAIGQLAAGVAHEINTPIQFIGDSLTFLQEGFEEIDRVLGQLASTEGARQSIAAEDVTYLRTELPLSLARCAAGLERVTKIVSSLRAFARADRERQEPADVTAAIQDTLTMVRTQLAQVCELELTLCPAPPVTCYIGEVRQVVLNLVTNAAHAIEERFQGSTRGTLRVSTFLDGPDFAISVTDDGSGIRPEIRDRVFEPFFTTKPLGKGTGQGLSLVHALVVRHGGSVGFVSSVSSGTTFTVRIPIAGAR